MNQLVTWKFIAENIAKSSPVVLLYVLESKGSSPGRQGFCMAVNQAGEMAGSIGGGIMEHKLVELAKERLKQESHYTEIKKQVHDKSATNNRSGMICSGEQTVYLNSAQEQDLNVINQIINCLQERTHHGTITITPSGFSFSSNALRESVYQYNNDSEWLFEMPIGILDRVHIIGGGHCSLALSKVMKDLQFYICVYEDREALNTFIQNEYADVKKSVSYEGMAEEIVSTPDDYIVIMTFGYRTDKIALRSLINTSYKYLGMLGSRNKISQLFEELRTEGVPGEQLNRVYAPIGLPIHSKTPEEIAVSIAGEIISIRNK